MTDPEFDLALRILHSLRQRRFEAFLAGGCVRDRLRGVTPNDYDVATNARPEAVQALFPRHVAIGKAFGVIIVVDGDARVEVTTYRAEGPYSDGRHPDAVTFSDLETDVRRRDFTINGMMWDPAADRVIDLVGGRDDLAARRLRTIGDAAARFEEDRLRMLRAVRFACELGFSIDPSTADAVRAQAPAILRVSAERIREELKRILVSPERDRGLQLLLDLGLLRPILPEVADLVGVAQPPEFHPEGDVFTHTALCLRHLEPPAWPLALATLLHDVGKPPTYSVSDRIRFHEHDKVGAEAGRTICDRLKLSNDEKERVIWVIEKHMAFKDVQQMRPSTLKRLLGHPFFSDLLAMHRADRLASGADLSNYDFCLARLRELPHEALRPKALINGHDLLALGLPPGPQIGKILREVEDAQLDGAVTTKEEALGLARRILETGAAAAP
jgi:tRNA nucleotidyltransferase/poly(A) polymerase